MCILRCFEGQQIWMWFTLDISRDSSNNHNAAMSNPLLKEPD